MEMKTPAMLGRRAGSNRANTCLKKPHHFSASAPRWCNVALTETFNFSSVVVNDQYGCLLLSSCMWLWLVFSLSWVGSLFKLSKYWKLHLSNLHQIRHSASLGPQQWTHEVWRKSNEPFIDVWLTNREKERKTDRQRLHAKTKEMFGQVLIPLVMDKSELPKGPGVIRDFSGSRS